MPLDFELLKIKVLGSSCRNKLQMIKEISDGWSQEDSAFPSERMEIELLIEYATQASEEIATLAEHLLSGPPAYNSNPDERRQRQLEVRVLSGIAYEDIIDLETRVTEIKIHEIDPMGTRMDEALSRVRRVCRRSTTTAVIPTTIRMR